MDSSLGSRVPPLSLVLRGKAVSAFAFVCFFLVFVKFYFLWLNLAQMSLMGETGLTPGALGAQKALFLCSVAHTDVQPCFSLLNPRPQAQFYTGLLLSILLRRCQPNFGLIC